MSDKDITIIRGITQDLVTAKRPCQKCGCDVAVKLVRVITSNGASQVYWECVRHKGGITTPRKNIPHDALKNQKVEIDKLPVIENYFERVICEVCGEPGAELHHFAPKHLFGEVEAERWPKSYLCVRCHRLWHDTVTPGMNQREK